MFVVETSEDEQTQTIFSCRLVPHLILDCRLGKLQLWKKAGEGTNPLIFPPALVHITSCARMGIHLVSVHLRPLLIIEDEKEE